MVRILLLLASLAAGPALHADEIPLESCDRLPVVEVRISGMKFIFLVDTAANSTLNLLSFAHGDPAKANVTSWSGTVEAKAQDVRVGDLAIGQHHFKNLQFLAIDLSAVGRACGRRIDGILGIDLLTRLGATLDLKTRPGRLLMDSETPQARIAELHAQLVACEQAFNRADEAFFAQCLDPHFVMFAVSGDYYGRDAAMEYFRRRYFHQRPPAQLAITPRDHHPIGDAIWVEYDFRITMADRAIQARGTALCEKTDGRWRIVHMNHSSPEIVGQVP